MPAFIQNCCAKHGLSTPSAVNTEENDENWQVGGTEGHMDCPSIFSDFLMVTNQSQPLIIKRQVLTDLAASMVHMIRRRKKRKGRKCCCYQCDQPTKMC